MDARLCDCELGFEAAARGRKKGGRGPTPRPRSGGTVQVEVPPLDLLEDGEDEVHQIYSPVVALSELCFKDAAWKILKDQMVILSKRRGHIKQDCCHQSHHEALHMAVVLPPTTTTGSGLIPVAAAQIQVGYDRRRCGRTSALAHLPLLSRRSFHLLLLPLPISTSLVHGRGTNFGKLLD